MPKDNFSTQAALYAKFRPKYPAELYDFVLEKVKNFNTAWDCATGNGQVASRLAETFEQVFATDISQKQLDNAHQAENIHYSIAQAEKTAFPDNTFDLITVGQAIHWFDFERFFQEVRRIAKPEAIFAAWGYGTLTIDNAQANTLFQDFYQTQIGEYWDSERRFIDEEYRSIPFPFEIMESPTFAMEYEWTLTELEGYLNTWSSVQKYIKIHHENPVDAFIESLKAIYQNTDILKVNFPVFMKMGEVK